MRYRFDPQLKQEKALAAQIHDALEGDVIDQVMEYTGAMEFDDSAMRAHLAVSKLRIEPEVMPRLYSVLEEVRQNLGFEREVEFYITNSPQINACTYFGTTKGRPLIIDLNSALIEMMSEDELKFVVGHELGHQIDGNDRLNKLIRFVYPDLEGMSPLLMRLKVNFWQQLCELVADRYGFLAVGDLATCVSAFFKMHSGLNLKGMNIDVQAFIRHNRETLRHVTEGNVLSLSNHDHPLDALRVEALAAFAYSSSQEELDGIMSSLISAMARIRTEEVDMKLPYFISAAGLIIANADGNVSQQEVEQILQTISSFHLFPKDVLDEVAKANPVEIFTRSLSEILNLRPDMKPALFRFVVDLVMSDNKLDIKEVNCMVDIGTRFFGYTTEEVMSLFAEAIREGFRPSFSALC